MKMEHQHLHRPTSIDGVTGITVTTVSNAIGGDYQKH